METITKFTAGCERIFSRLLEAGATKQLKRLVRNMEDMVDEYQAQAAKDPAMAARRLHSSIDMCIDSSRGIQSQKSCRKGCSFCCYQPIIISQEEAILLKDKPMNLERLEKQKYITSLEDHTGLPHADSACIFLENGECSVYEDRPAVCRKYFVASPPSDCDTLRRAGEEIAILAQDEAEVFTTVMLNATRTGLMAEMITEAK